MWLEFESLVNARDVGGIQTPSGAVQPKRLIRSDNLQELTEADLRQLENLGVTDVVDLRSHYEVHHEGPGPLQRNEKIRFHNHSFLPEQHDDDAPEAHSETIISDDAERRCTSDDAERPGTSDDAERPGQRLPWMDKKDAIKLQNPFASHYLGYIMDRPASVVAALRGIAHADGAALVHCAAGKDRTGTTVALALSLVDADRDQIVADYAASSERMQKIVDRLLARETYRAGLEGRSLDSHMTRPESMFAVLEYIDTEWGGVPRLMEQLGWNAKDQAALQAKLLG